MTQEPIYRKCAKCGQLRVVQPEGSLCFDCFWENMKLAEKELKAEGILDSEGFLKNDYPFSEQE
jgi:uncharacterized OB-fold protein